MSFVSPFQTEYFLIDRVTRRGRLVRRVLAVTNDGAVIMCKPSGTTCRVLHAGNISSVLTAPWEGLAGVGILLRLENEPDLLFRHALPPRVLAPSPSSSSVVHSHSAEGGGGRSCLKKGERFADGLVDSYFGGIPSSASGSRGRTQTIDVVQSSRLLQNAHRFLECLEFVRSSTGGPLEVTPRASLEELVGAADLQRFADQRRKPEFAPVTNTMLLPSIFDPFVIKSKPSNEYDSRRSEAVNMFTDISFLTMLGHAVERSPVAATTAPLLTVEAPNPFRSVIVNESFFEAFTSAYCEALCLVINAHGPLPHLVSFRASPNFWQFFRKRNQHIRPAPSALSNLVDDHVEVYVVGEESQTTTVIPLAEWNQTIVDWELQVRRRMDTADDALSAAFSAHTGNIEDGATDEAVWAAFLEEAQLMMESVPPLGVGGVEGIGKVAHHSSLNGNGGGNPLGIEFSSPMWYPSPLLNAHAKTRSRSTNGGGVLGPLSPKEQRQLYDDL